MNHLLFMAIAIKKVVTSFVAVLSLVLVTVIIDKPFDDVTRITYGDFGAWVVSADLGLRGGYYVNQEYVVNTELFIEPELKFVWSIQDGYEWKKVYLSTNKGFSYTSNTQDVGQ